jgi:hypothetical protein
MNAHDVAAESYRFWRGLGYFHLHACAWLSMQDGETSCSYSPPPVPAGAHSFPVGDHGHAFGPLQHQRPRIAIMAAPPPKGCGIDISDPQITLQQALTATDWETTAGPPPYRQVRPALLATTTRDAAVTLLVTKFEKSLNPDNRDVDRRNHLFDYWDKVFAG